MVFEQFQILTRKLKVSDELAAEMLGMTNQQFADLTPETELNEQGQLYTENLSDLINRGTAVFEDSGKFIAWMNTQIPFYNLLRPIDVAKTLQGIKEIEEELGRIDYGILS